MKEKFEQDHLGKVMLAMTLPLLFSLSFVSAQGATIRGTIAHVTPFRDVVLKEGWEFRWHGGVWTPVTVPHDWAMQDDHPWTIGEFVWTGFDYLGEPTPYDEIWPSRSSYFGIFDLAGLPKDRYWLYRSRWNTSSHTLHLVPHWTFPGREGEVTPVYCYTDFDEAELFVNGKSQGRRRKDPTFRLDRYRLRWNEVVYEPGELKVVAYGRDGLPAMTKCVRTAGEPVRVDLARRRFGRLLFVTATLVDALGTLVPNADRTLSFSCGRGLRFRAICNGDATSVESFAEPHMRTFHGQLVVAFEGEGCEVECEFIQN